MPAMNQFGLVQAVERLSQGVVIAVALAAHRGGNSGLGRSLAVADVRVLRLPVRVVIQCAISLGLSCVQRLLQRIQ